jgi:hypothetical protein
MDGGRPAWTSMADWVSAAEGGASGTVAVLPAPVVTQWTEQIARPGAVTSLLVLDYAANKATIVHRFVESLPLSIRLADRDVADHVRTCVTDAERGLDALRGACLHLLWKRAPARKERQRARAEKDRLHDLTASFWQRTEPAFWAAYEAFVSEEGDGQADAQEKLRRTIRKTGLDLFDAWASPSLGDPSRVAVIARVRARLVRDLPWSQRAGEAPGEHAA